jgi:SAM-dependent methyltransferase
MSEIDSILRLEAAFAAPFNQIISDQVSDCRKILDIGCGGASLGIELDSRKPGRIYWGIDNDPQKINAARRYESVARGSFILLRAVFMQASLPEAFFDAAVSVMALHISFSLSTVEKVHSTLETGGRVCFIALDSTYAPLTSFDKPETGKGSFLYRHLPADQLARWLDAARKLYAQPRMIDHIKNLTGPVLIIDEFLSIWSKLFTMVQSFEVWPGIYFARFMKQ